VSATAKGGGSATTQLGPPGGVREITIPPDAEALSTLPRVDYTDGFLLTVPRIRERTAQEWARAMLEGASASTRSELRRGWFVLGVRLGSTEDQERVLGWQVRRSSPDVALLAADSLFGMQAEILFRREREALLVATIMKLNNVPFRAFWTVFSAQHRRVVRGLLKDCGRRWL